MAMSFTRPDPSSPASIADASFSTARRGFDQHEVRDFMRMVAAELGRLQERERFLERELRTVQSKPDLGSIELDEQALTRLLGEETARVLTTARESAAEIRQKAEQSASQLLSEASDEAARVREEAEIEASRRRSDAGADAEAELSMAKQQGREMVNEARAYRERVLSELARRRELAREQIEQLLHGRDRLMQSFERARLVAVDVVAELQPLGEPDEYVNLSPTTGPVPVMLPNAGRPAAPDRSRDDIGAASDDLVAPDPRTDDADDDDTLDAVTVEDVTVEELVEDADAESVVADADTVEGDDETATIAEPAADDDAPDDDDAPADEDATVDPDDAAIADDDDATTADDAITVDDATSADVTATDGEIERDDVVVDLFARLRADTRPVPAAVDATALTVDADETVALDAAALADSAPSAVSSDSSDSGDLADPAESEPTPFEQRAADITPLIVSSARRIKRVLADEQNEALDALRRNEPVRSLDDLLPVAKEHLQRYRSAILDDLVVAANAGASGVGRSSPLSKTAAGRAVEAADAVLDEWVTLPLRERLERCVVDGDGDNASISRSVRAVYREWKTQHIDEQLDDVIRTAHGRGAFDAITTGTPIRWVSDADHRACADCDDNTLAGAVAAGEEFPTGHLFAPAHLGCRCILVPADR